MSRNLAVIKEKDGMRGLVPSRKFGIKDRTYGAYLQRLDPRNNEDMQRALATCTDNRFNEFLERIMLNRYKRVSVQTIAKACNISLLEFQNWWNRESTQVAIAVAQTESIEITRDMAGDARSIDSVCPRCDGLKWISAPANLPKDTKGYKGLGDPKDNMWIRDCPVCDNGRVRKPGDAHARDKIMELSGLIKKGPGVNLNLNFGAQSHASAVSSLDNDMPMTVDGSVD